MVGKDCKIHKLVADVLVLAEDQVLFVSYRDLKNYDGQRGWFLPDDYLAYAEHPGAAAQRILREQVGLESSDITLGYIESFGGEDKSPWHLVFHYTLKLGRIPIAAPLTNVKAAEWFPLDKLPDRPSVAHEGWGLDVIGTLLDQKV